MNDGLRELADLHFLGRIARGESGYVSTSQLEQDFLHFSAYVTESEITVVMPKLYQLRGEEQGRFAKTLEAICYKGKTPEAIDMAGNFDGNSVSGNIIISSLQQHEADILDCCDHYLSPLLAQVYIRGGQMIMDFTIHSTLSGKVKMMSGNLNLEEAHLFPERFRRGAYTLSVSLDTPERFVTSFTEIMGEIQGIKAEPFPALLDFPKIEALTSKAIGLRKSLGALSRYNAPETNEIDAQSNSCIIETENSSLFYLYEPIKRKNILVYFGENPFKTVPTNLTILNGSEHENTLVSMIDMGFFAPSTAVLEKRICDLTAMYDNAARSMNLPLSEGYQDFQRLIEKLKDVLAHFNVVINADMRKKYTETLPAELLEFLVYPVSTDPVIHALLPMLSWNASIREYHDTKRFMSVFSESNDEQRKAMLSKVKSDMMFSNQENNSVNYWLYHNHREMCERSGIKFKVKQMGG